MKKTNSVFRFLSILCILSVFSTLLITSCAPPKAESATVYTCPMHPEVIQEKPGDCPKCGMELVPKAQEGNE